MHAYVHTHLSTLIWVTGAVWIHGIIVGAAGLKLITMGKKWQS